MLLRKSNTTSTLERKNKEDLPQLKQIVVESLKDLK